MPVVFPQRCPVCEVVALNGHCTSPTCPWRSCRNKACGVVLDLAANRGIKPTGGQRWLSFRINT